MTGRLRYRFLGHQRLLACLQKITLRANDRRGDLPCRVRCCEESKDGRVLEPEVAEFAMREPAAAGRRVWGRHGCGLRLSSQPEHRPHSAQQHASPIFRASLFSEHTYTPISIVPARRDTHAAVLRAAHPVFQRAKQLPPASRRGCRRRSCQLFSISAPALVPNHHNCPRLDAE